MLFPCNLGGERRGSDIVVKPFPSNRLRPQKKAISWRVIAGKKTNPFIISRPFSPGPEKAASGADRREKKASRREGCREKRKSSRHALKKSEFIS